jgi:hypothetical protein
MGSPIKLVGGTVFYWSEFEKLLHFWWLFVPTYRNSIFFFSFNGPALITRPDIHLLHPKSDTGHVPLYLFMTSAED